MRPEGDPSVRGFQASLRRAIERYGDLSEEDVTTRQRRQVENLVALETHFREVLIRHPAGRKVYKAFIEMVREEKRNILDARPYFRERQELFMAQISPALKVNDIDALHPYAINYLFVAFVMRCRKWATQGRQARFDLQIVETARAIQDQRTELVELNMPLALSRAKIFWNRTRRFSKLDTREVLPGGAALEYMDLVQICAEGLIAGVDKFVLPYTPVFRSVCIGRMVGDLIDSASLDGDLILTPCGQEPKKIKDFHPGDRISAVDETGSTIETEVVALHDHGVLEGVEVVFDDGYQLVCSEDHKFLTEEGMAPLKEILGSGLGVFCESAAASGRVGNSVWSTGDESATDVPPPEGLSGLSDLHFRENGNRGQICPILGVEALLPEDGGLGVPVWGDVREQAAVLGSPPGVRSVSSEDCRKSGDQNNRLEGQESGDGSPEHGPGLGDFSAKVEGRSCVCQGAFCGCARSHPSMEGGPPRGGGGNHQKTPFGSDAVELRELAEIERYFDLAGSTDSLRGGEKAGGLRLSGPQGLGGGGRVLALLCPQEYGQGEGAARGATVAGRLSEGRGSAPQGCDADPDRDRLLQVQVSVEAGMARLAYANSPLTSTGGLVLRRIVRARPVGPRRMYDLEVSHPKHNFLLPNGVVTSNSETLLHFFPGDKRKIYRARKCLGRGIDLATQGAVDEINKDVDPRHWTTKGEVAELMAATACESSDVEVQDSTGESDDGVALLDTFETPPAEQPDHLAEDREARERLSQGVGGLSLREQKLLRLRGVNMEASGG